MKRQKLRLRTDRKTGDKWIVYVLNHSNNEEGFYTKTIEFARKIFDIAMLSGYEARITSVNNK